MATQVKPEPIVLSIETPADVETAWSALTDPDRVAEWFTDVSPLGAIGDPYRIDFGDSAVEGVIVDVQPGRRFAYTWRWEGSDAGEQTLVSWTVEPVGDDGTRISLEHTGWPSTTADDTTRDDHAGYWQAYLEDLEALLAG
jgi:uncharacterized protein YndB with AHSA1/START domain